jgi:uncharacterized repeat protein (TIGR03803 family)
MWITSLTGRVLCLVVATLAITLVPPSSAGAQQTAKYEIVSSFGAADGTPNGVIQTSTGQFYGSTRLPQVSPTSPLGTLFAMDASGARTTLHTFFINLGAGGPNGDGTPIGNLIEGGDGIVYGTSYSPRDPPIPPGRIFAISRDGVYSTVASAHSLRAGVIQRSDGRLYGVFDGEEGVVNPLIRSYGSVFRVEAGGAITVIHEFDGTDSVNPVGELVETIDGSLYGVTSGGTLRPPPSGPLPPPVPAAIFRIDADTGVLAIVHRFANGVTSAGHLIQAVDGLLYGTTVNGGDFGFGTVFSLDAAGTFTTLHHFSGADGANPSAGLIQGGDGRLYGTTRNRGAFGYGTVFVMSAPGRAITLHDFELSMGANPVDELFQANDGVFYGSAPMGGPDGHGVIFRLRVAPVAPEGYVEIVSRNSGKCLNVAYASTEPAASVIQWPCVGARNEQWRLEPAGGGAFRIIARHRGQALDVSGGSLDDVAPIIQWPIHGGDNQTWILESESDGHVRIVARHSGKAMDVEFASADDGARVIQYAPHGGTNQQWLLRPVASPTTSVATVIAR